MRSDIDGSPTAPDKAKSSAVNDAMFATESALLVSVRSPTLLSV